MLVIVPDNGVNRVCLACDVCGGLVEDGRMAIVRWDATPGAPTIPAVVVHKGRCAGRRGDREMFIEADTAAVYLLANLTDDEDGAKERAGHMASL